MQRATPQSQAVSLLHDLVTRQMCDKIADVVCMEIEIHVYSTHPTHIFTVQVSNMLCLPV